jgi:hypothetical protein
MDCREKDIEMVEGWNGRSRVTEEVSRGLPVDMSKWAWVVEEGAKSRRKLVGAHTLDRRASVRGIDMGKFERKAQRK